MQSVWVIPKKLQPGKWRLILDLSSPEDHSVNAGIPREPFSIRYISVDVAIKVLMELGPQALMAKFYVLSAYRNIPIHPDDCHLLGISAATISMSISRCPLVSAPHPSFLILLRP